MSLRGCAPSAAPGWDGAVFASSSQPTAAKQGRGVGVCDWLQRDQAKSSMLVPDGPLETSQLDSGGLLHAVAAQEPKTGYHESRTLSAYRTPLYFVLRMWGLYYNVNNRHDGNEVGKAQKRSDCRAS